MRKVKDIEYEVDSNGCWNCTSHALSSGYPRKMINKQSIQLSRFVYAEHNGAIPEDMVIRHTCDNPKCINPSHLVIGTRSDNMKDMVERNRINRGIVKLSERDIELIKYAYHSEKYTERQLAKLFGVGISAIHKILTNV